VTDWLYYCDFDFFDGSKYECWVQPATGFDGRCMMVCIRGAALGSRTEYPSGFAFLDAQYEKYMQARRSDHAQRSGRAGRRAGRFRG